MVYLASFTSSRSAENVACVLESLLQNVRFRSYARFSIQTNIGETLDSVSTVFNEIAQHPPHTLFAVCNWSIGHPR